MYDKFYFSIPEHHPVFEGHFPGQPIVPGVMLVDEVIHVLETQGEKRMKEGGYIAITKFLSPVAPGEVLTISIDLNDDALITFGISTRDRMIAKGTFSACKSESNK